MAPGIRERTSGSSRWRSSRRRTGVGYRDDARAGTYCRVGSAVDSAASSWRSRSCVTVGFSIAAGIAALVASSPGAPTPVCTGRRCSPCVFWGVMSGCRRPSEGSWRGSPGERRRKLLELYYREQISGELFAEEEQRLADQIESVRAEASEEHRKHVAAGPIVLEASTETVTDCQDYNPNTGGYGYRNCTDFVAWRVSQAPDYFTMPSAAKMVNGNASYWGTYFADHGLSS